MQPGHHRAFGDVELGGGGLIGEPVEIDESNYLAIVVRQLVEGVGEYRIDNGIDDDVLGTGAFGREFDRAPPARSRWRSGWPFGDAPVDAAAFDTIR